jgi:hypothetical protein
MTAKCPSCSAAILWVRTEKGRRMPLDPEPCEGGNVIVKMGSRLGQETVHVETKDETEKRLKCTIDAGRLAYMPHFATCTKPPRKR